MLTKENPLVFFEAASAARVRGAKAAPRKISSLSGISISIYLRGVERQRMTYEDVEPLRASYRPTKIKVLFVGENAPAGGAFFYRQTGQVHGQFRQALAPHIGDNPTFVDAFKQAGFYLDDQVLEPVNWLSRSERKAIHAANVISLATRLRDYEAPLIVAFMKGIAAPVKAAIAASGTPSHFEVVPFPGNGRQAEFRSAMKAIMPKLLNR